MDSPAPVSESEWNAFGKIWRIKWFEVEKLEDIPADHSNFTQVYAVAVPKGSHDAVIVQYDADADNLPGGKPEPGESIEQTLHRELDEEINSQVLAWEPLGYQEVKPADDSAKPIYQLRVLAHVAINKPFEKGDDPAGAITGNKRVPLTELAQTINHGAVGERLQALAIEKIDQL